MSNYRYFGETPEGMDNVEQSTAALPNFKDVIVATHSGDVDQVAGAVGTYTERVIASLSNPMVLGPAALIYAMKGRLSFFERSVLGLMGIFTLYGFGKTKTGEHKEWLQQFHTRSNQATPSQASQQPTLEIIGDGQKSTT